MGAAAKLKSVPIPADARGPSIELSFEPIAQHWRKLSRRFSPRQRSYVENLLQRYSQSPLSAANLNVESLTVEEHFVREFLQLHVPSWSENEPYTAAAIPVSYEPFCTSLGFETSHKGGIATIHKSSNLCSSNQEVMDLWLAYDAICEHYFNRTIRNTTTGVSSLLSIHYPKTNLTKTFMLSYDNTYVDIRSSIPPDSITADDWHELLNNMDINLWQKKIPLNSFSFHGVTLLRVSEITFRFEFNRIRRNLVSADKLEEPATFSAIEDSIRNILQNPEISIELSLAYNSVYLHMCRRNEDPADIQDSVHPSTDLQFHEHPESEIAGTVFEQALRSKKAFFSGNINNDKVCLPFSTAKNYPLLNSILIVPLFHEGKHVGFYQLLCPQEDVFNHLTHSILAELDIILSIVMRKNIDEMRKEIDLILRNKCTALHPSVEWKFKEAAQEYLFALGRKNNQIDFPEIVLEKLYPLFGVTDIRGSSDLRNQAICRDLITQTNLALKMIDEFKEIQTIDLMNLVSFQLAEVRRKLELGIDAREEQSITMLLRDELNSMIDNLVVIDDRFSEPVERYRKELDPKTQMVYRARRDFDESVRAINQLISTRLDAFEQRLQESSPHYFEKQATDGVEHTIYIGSDTFPDGEFQLLHLRNIRLAQLLAMCQIGREAQELSAQLKVPLQVTHLLMVQNSTLTLHFDFDEKELVVAGAYNIRYQIIKKRIDKATTKGSGQRLTQVNQISIVYSQKSEEQEYLTYLEFLRHKGEIEADVEFLELEDLQSLQGLKALRVSIALHPSQV